MWFPETTFDWVIVGYIVAGLIYVAHGYNELNSKRGRETAEQTGGPMPPEFFRIFYPVVSVLVMIVAFLIWPVVLGWEIYDQYTKRNH